MRFLFLILLSLNVMASDHSIVNESEKSIQIRLGDNKKLELNKKNWISLEFKSIRPKNTPLTVAMLDTPGVIIEISKIATLIKKRSLYCQELGLANSCRKNTVIDSKEGIIEDLIIVDSAKKFEMGIYYHISLKYNKKDLKNKELKEILEVINEKKN